MSKTTDSLPPPSPAWIEDNPLRRWRRERWLSQNDVAAQLGVHHVYIWRWETGQILLPERASMQKMADLMGVSLIELGKAWWAWLRSRKSK